MNTFETLFNKVAERLVNMPYFWCVDFDEDAYRDLIPNFDELRDGDITEFAKAVINASDWCLAEWIEYLADDELMAEYNSLD